MDCVWDKKSKPRRAEIFQILGTHRRFALEREFKYDTHVRVGVNGKSAATTVVRIVRSEHPSGGAHGTEL